MCAAFPSVSPAQTGFIPVTNARLYYRVIGRGQPLLVLHGGPDFDHTYLLPDMDRLSGPFRLIYYDQRGRGRSAGGVQPEEVTMRSEVEDLESVRKYFELESAAVVGHSWGALLALEYALQHPQRVSHLILLNTAPVSHEDYLLLRQDRRTRAAADIEKLKVLALDARYRQGDPATVAAYYRIHFRAALKHPEHLETVIQRLRSSFAQEGILKARAIEKHLLNETWLSSEYDLLPKLQHLTIPTLIIHGEDDFIPVECAAHVAQAIPGARFALLKECGHFSYLECPEEACEQIRSFFQINNSSS